MLYTIFDSDVLELGVFGLLRCGQDKGRVCCGILGLVFADGCGVSVLYSRIQIEDLEGGLEMLGRCGSIHAKSPVKCMSAQAFSGGMWQFIPESLTTVYAVIDG